MRGARIHSQTSDGGGGAGRTEAEADRYADGTLGGAGHAASILAASSPTGWLSGCDHDGVAVEAAKKRLAEKFVGRFEIRRENFSEMAGWIPAVSCDGVLLDLGVSSPQLDSPGRGFSFQHDGPLDMRMDDRQSLTATDLVNGLCAEELAKIFWEFGDERESRRFAKAIVHDRAQQKFETTRQLAELIERLVPRHGKKAHPATKVHSLEDRVVKEFGRERTRDYTFAGKMDMPELRQPHLPEMKWVSRRAIQPGEVELKENPRSRSAQLRVLEKI
jgi:16S rRNA (cytosine1402-N4)-methyltransferase